MTQQEIDPELQKTIRTVSVALAPIILTSLFVYHLWCLYKHYYLPKTYLAHKLSISLTLTLFLWGLIWSYRGFINFFIGYTKFSCYSGVVFAIPTYYMFKLNIYLILADRLYTTYAKAMIYKAVYLKIWAAILIIWTVINLICANIGFTVEWNGRNGLPPCDLSANPLGFEMSLFMDIIVGLINIYLFVSPLLKLSKGKDNNELNKIAAKQSILSIITILTTVFALIGMMYIDLPLFLFNQDFICSTVCIILMYKWNSKIVDKICCCFLRKYTKTIDDASKTDNLEDNTKTNTNESKPEIIINESGTKTFATIDLDDIKSRQMVRVTSISSASKPANKSVSSDISNIDK